VTPRQRVAFGTSGHRGSSLNGSFTRAHILGITQAICDYRRSQGIDGPLYMGKDTHALSRPAEKTALEVLAANDVPTIIQRDDGVTPTPVISRAILVYNRGRQNHLADGIIITPSHNPPEDGGFKYNPTNGGPADIDITQWVEDRANALLEAGNAGVKRVPFNSALKATTTHEEDFVEPYVADLANVVDMDSIRAAGLKARCRPPWRRLGTLLGSHPSGVQLGSDGRQSQDRSHLLLHDRRSRRQDPDGLLQPVRHGPPGGAQGPVPGRLRQ
jgi:phosphoglucomutase